MLRRPLAAVLALSGGFFARADPVWGGLLLGGALAAAFWGFTALRARVLAAAALLLLAAAGWRGALPRNAATLPDGVLRFRGVVAEDPSAARLGPRLLVDLEASSRGPDSAWVPRTGRALVQVLGGPEPPPRRGDVTLFEARLRPPVALRNPGSQSFRSYLGRKGVDARASATWPGSIAFAEPGPGAPSWLRWRRRTGLAVLEAAPGQPGAVLNALLLGDWSGISAETSDSFRACGTTHLVAISGLHLGILAMLITPLWRRLLLLHPGAGLSTPVEPLARTLAVPFLVAFAGLSGFQTTTLRALVMTGLLILASAWSRPTHPLTVLCSAVLLLALPKPAVLADPGLHLSAAALAGLFWLSPRLEARLTPAAEEDPLAPPPGRLRRLAHAAGRAGRRLACAGISASLATMPVAAFHFGSTSALGLAVNPFAVPLAEFFCLPVALLGLALSPVSTELAGLFWWASGKGLALLLWAQGHLAPYAPQLEWAPLKTAWGLAGALSVLAALGYALERPPRAARTAAAVAVGVLGLTVPAFAHWAASAFDPAVHLWALDVGQGQALVFRIPDGLKSPRWVLVDAGGFAGSDFDTGERIVVPALEALGCDRLWLAVSTHPHPDHLGGMASAVRLARPATLWMPGAFAGDERYAGLLSAAAEAGATVRWVGREGIAVRAGEAELRATWVPGPTENDRCLVLKVSSGGRTALLPTDLQAEGQELLLAAGYSPRCDVLVAPHHGAANAVNAPFLEAARPSLYVISSAGRPGLPSAQALAEAARLGAEVRGTYQAGCLEVTLSKERVTVRAEGER